MAQTFDLVLANGTVVNQDGTGVGDIGVLDGRIAAIKSPAAASTVETIAYQTPEYPAGCKALILPA